MSISAFNKAFSKIRHMFAHMSNPYNVNIETNTLKSLNPNYYLKMLANNIYDLNTIECYEKVSIDFAITIMEFIEKQNYTYGQCNLDGERAYIIYRMVHKRRLNIAYIYFSEFTPVIYCPVATQNERSIINEQVDKYFKFARSHGGYFV